MAQDKKRQDFIWVLMIVAAFIVLGLGIFLPAPERNLYPEQALETVNRSGNHTQSLLEAPTGGVIRLPAGTHRTPFDSSDLLGYYVWLYFGYTACADACPMSLGWISVALSQLPPEWEGRVRGLFISVDPERDTPDHLRQYVSHFHENIEAATGNIEQLQQLAADYGVFFQHVPVDSALGYVVDHSSVVFLLGPDGAILEVYPHGFSPRDLLESLPSQPTVQVPGFLAER